jgi:hypothetical protein
MNFLEAALTRQRVRLILSTCLLLGACAVESPVVPATPSPTGEPRDYHAFSSPKEVGPGFLAGMSLDGSAAYVADTDDAFPQPGCEGQPESVLFRLPLSGGARELQGDGKTPLKGNLVRGPDGRIALVDLCEGFFQGLAVGKESPDGHLTEVKEVMLTRREGEGPPAPFSFSWTLDGSSLLAAINDPDAPDGGPSRLVSINPDTGAITELFTGEGGSGVFQFAQLEGGTYVMSSNRLVSFRDEEGGIVAGFPGNGFEIFSDNKRVAIYGETLAVATEGSKVIEALVPNRPDYEISSASVSPDGKAVSFNRYALQTSDVEIGVVTVEDSKRSSVVAGTSYGSAMFSGDGKALGFNEFVSGPDFSVRVLLVQLGG